MKKIFIPLSGITLVVNAADIICLEGNRSFTHIYVQCLSEPKGWREIISGHTLGHFEALLPPRLFTRVSKKHVVGLNHVTGVEAGNIACLSCKCGSTVHISKAYCTDLLAMVGQLEMA